MQYLKDPGLIDGLMEHYRIWSIQANFIWLETAAMDVFSPVIEPNPLNNAEMCFPSVGVF